MSKYSEETRSVAFGLIATVPLIIFYELSNYYYNYERGSAIELRNAAEMFIKNALGVIGLSHPLAQAFVYITLTLIFYSILKRRGGSLPRLFYFAIVLFESIIYAAVFGTVTRSLTKIVLSLQTAVNSASLDILSQILLAIAAGIYEELLFRLVLLGGLLVFLKQLMNSAVWLQVSIAVLISALLFSLFHYPSWEFFSGHTFSFRFIAGIILGLLFVWRGLAVVVYTHALYDLLLVLSFNS